MKRLLLATTLLFLVMGCTEDEKEPIRINLTDKTLLVTETDYTTGSIGSVDQSNTHNTELTIHSDAVIYSHKDDIYLLERTGGDNISKFDKEGYQVYQTHIADGWNPHDVAIVSDTIGYICGNSASNLFIFNPATGDSIGSIDLTEYAYNTVPHATAMELVGTKLYVALQRRDAFNPGGVSQVVEIDVTTNKATKVISCKFKNVQDMEYINDALYVVNFGGYSPEVSGANGDAAVEKINLTDYSVTTVLEGLILEGDIQDIEFKDENSFYFSAYKSWGDAPVALYDISSNTVIDTITTVTQSAGLARDAESKKLYILEGSAGKAGVVTYDETTKKATTVKTKLTPSSITLL